MEQLDYNLLFRWFVGLRMDERGLGRDGVHARTAIGCCAGEIAEAFFAQVIGAGARRGLAVGRALHGGRDADRGVGGPEELPAAGRGPATARGTVERDFHGRAAQERDARSTTDPEARLYKKGAGKEAKLVLPGARAGGQPPRARWSGTRDDAGAAARPSGRRRRGCCGDRTPPAPRAYAWAGQGLRQHAGFVEACASDRRALPHVAQYVGRRSAVDGRTTRHPGYAISQLRRKRIEQSFGWMKTVGLLRKVRHRGRRRVGWMFTFTAAVYDLVRMRTLLWAT